MGIELTGLDDEWIAHYHCDGLFQNSKCRGVFKYKNEQAYYFDAIQWRDERAYCWNGTALIEIENKEASALSSRQFIKSFPFTPKTFIIDVVSYGGSIKVKDVHQLAKVYRYYDVRPENHPCDLTSFDKTVYKLIYG